MLGFSKKTIDPLQTRSTGVASDGTPIRRPDERGRERRSAAEILARLEGYAAAARGEPLPVGTDPTTGTTRIKTSQPPWPADTLLPQPARRGQRSRAQAAAPAIAIDSPPASTASPAAHPQPIQPARHGPRLAPQAAPLALAALSCILAILAFERLDNVIAAALSAALTLVGVIASFDAYQRHGGVLLIAATDP